MLELGNLQNEYFLLRHGESTANAKGVVASGSRARRGYGLTPKGSEQVIFTAQHSQDQFTPDTLIFTSPLRRARETAELFADGIGVSRENIHVLNDLRERSFDVDDGRSAAAYEKNIWPHDPLYPYQRIDAESTEQVLRRMLRVIELMEQKYNGRRIVFVGHGDPFQILQTAFTQENMSSGQHRSLPHMENAQLIQLPTRRYRS